MDYMRINAAQCGATLGKYILVVERNPVDTNYSEDIKVYLEGTDDEETEEEALDV